MFNIKHNTVIHSFNQFTFKQTFRLNKLFINSQCYQDSSFENPNLPFLK